MATQAKKNYMRAEANKRLQLAVNKLAELQGIAPVTTTIKMRDKDMISIKVTENMADFIETLIDTPVVSNADESVLSEARALVESGSWTKAEMESVLLGDD